MIKIKQVTMKNFLSVGNVPQTLRFNNIDLTLMLGNNLDQSDADSRNGAGKSTGIQAVSFGLFGTPLSQIKKDNLINNINQKDMVVIIEFEKNGVEYRVERGRKPNYMKYTVNNTEINAPDVDESLGESKWTQNEIEKVVGMSHTLFKHIVALHTRTTPFLSLGAAAQREIIEELISITQLSRKADTLRQNIKVVKDEIKAEDVRLSTIKSSNERVESAINGLKAKKNLWDREHSKRVATLTEKLLQISTFDIEAEIESHKKQQELNRLSGEYALIEKQLKSLIREQASLKSQTDMLVEKIQMAQDHKCHACGQDIHDNINEQMLNDLGSNLISITERSDEIVGEIDVYENAAKIIADDILKIGDVPACVYSSIEEAINQKNKIDTMQKDITREEETVNPYIEQIETLATNGLQELSYDMINNLTEIKEHQDFLLKLLTSKDSFIRKKIIDQNIAFLNTRLGVYLEKLNLPHEVIFRNDLSVDIIKHGREYDFEQLSNGEQNRLILSLTWAFRDCWEIMYGKLNVMIIDELVDSGMDNAGTEAALDVLKSFVREHNKDIFLISHKDILTNRVDRIIYAQKENDFTSYIDNED